VGHRDKDPAQSVCSLRPVCEADEPALRAIFVAIRRGPMDAAGFDAVTVVRLVEHQFELQRAGHRLTYPNAASQAIILDGELVGRLITDDDDERVVLVDVMIDPAHQRQGIGSHVLVDLIVRCGRRPIELRLGHGSAAEAWYRRHGFEQVAHDDVQVHLVRAPATSALSSTAR
jgi:ribosomal protein S18 acetylase RimI-like enzyme